MDIVKNAQDVANHTASQAKSGLAELGTEALKLIGSLRKMESRGVDNALDYIGLQRKQSMLVPVATFAAGAVIGGAVALLVTPTAGTQLRRKIAKFLTDEVKEVEGQAKSLVSEIKDASRSATSSMMGAAKNNNNNTEDPAKTIARDPNGTRIPHS